MGLRERGRQKIFLNDWQIVVSQVTIFIFVSKVQISGMIKKETEESYSIASHPRPHNVHCCSFHFQIFKFQIFFMGILMCSNSCHILKSSPLTAMFPSSYFHPNSCLYCVATSPLLLNTPNWFLPLALNSTDRTWSSCSIASFCEQHCCSPDAGTRNLSLVASPPHPHTSTSLQVLWCLCPEYPLNSFTCPFL